MCQREILDVCWWVYVYNAEVLQRSSLSTIGDILRHRRLSLFGHVARLDPGVPAHDALRLIVDTYEGRKPTTSWRRPPGRPSNVWLNKVQEDANALPLSTLWRYEIARGRGSAQRSTRTTRRRWWWFTTCHTYYCVSKCRQSADPHITHRLLTKVLDLVNEV